MGQILTMPDEAGEYSVEVRRESFYLVGEDAYDHQFQDAPPPRHAITLYPGIRAATTQPIDKDLLTIVLYVIDELIEELPGQVGAGGIPGAPKVAWIMVKNELARALAEEANISNRVPRVGNIEILIEDIPKIRACLDAVEEHVAKR